MNNKKVVVLIIYKATNQTATFKKVDYIRVGSYTAKLNEYPQMQAQLWDKLRNSRFEEQYAKQDLTDEEAVRLLDFSIYFDIKKEPTPTNISGLVHYMLEECVLSNINIYEENTKVTLFSKIDFFDLPQRDKLWACYMHACIKYIQNEFLTNSSLRERFGLEEKSSASISRLIKEACEQKYIKKLEDTSPRHTKYIPYWA